MRTKIRQLTQRYKDGDTVTAHGWVKSKRVSKNFAFLMLNDGSQQQDFQVVIDANTPAWGKLEPVNTGAAVAIEGVLKASVGSGQKFEIHGRDMIVYGLADPEKYPLQKKGHTLEFLRDIGHLRCRTNTFGAVYRVRNSLSYLVHQFFQDRGFYWAHTPIVTANDCEGAGEMFVVTTLDLDALAKKSAPTTIDFSQDFFGKRAHLTVSGQLEGETLACGLGDIYTFGPTFRAENSNTTRHLSEFWMIEPEMAFADLHDNMELAEEFLKFLCRGVLKECPGELAFLAQHYKQITTDEIAALGEAKFQRMTYTEAVEILQGAPAKFEFPVKWGIDLQAEHERYLTDHICKGPVIVTNYPKDIKAFYMRQNDDGRTVAAMDVLAPRIGEIIGGSQREERLDLLENRMDSMQIPKSELWWYLDLRRYGSVPHAGFGLGFERVVQYLTGMGNIRDVIPYPRAPKTIAF